jgi:hypothetical protein
MECRASNPVWFCLFYRLAMDDQPEKGYMKEDYTRKLDRMNRMFSNRFKARQPVVAKIVFPDDVP